MGKNKKQIAKVELPTMQLESIIRQIARVENGEHSSFTLKELKKIKAKILEQING